MLIWEPVHERPSREAAFVRHARAALSVGLACSHTTQYAPRARPPSALHLAFPEQAPNRHDSDRVLGAAMSLSAALNKVFFGEIAWPSGVIKVVSAEEPGRPLNRFAETYTFDVTRCVFCGFCVDACPVDALAMTKEYEWASENKRTLFLD